MKQSSVIALLATVASAASIHHGHQQKHAHERRDAQGYGAPTQQHSPPSYSAPQPKGPPSAEEWDKTNKAAIQSMIAAQQSMVADLDKINANHPGYKPQAPGYGQPPAAQPTQAPAQPPQPPQQYGPPKPKPHQGRPKPKPRPQPPQQPPQPPQYQPKPPHSPPKPPQQPPKPPQQPPKPPHNPPKPPHGSPNHGKVTYYAAGLGSCGQTNGNSDPIVALSHEYMDTGKAQYCGKKVQIKGPGGTFPATIADTCMGCEKTHLDLPEGFYMQVTNGNKDAGHVPVTWSFM